MYDALERSIGLNRLLARNLETALKRDQTIRIGWSKEGEERPRKGDTGFAPAIPAGARILLLGDLGDFVGVGWAGASLTISGSAESHCGAWALGGRILVEGRVGRRAGHGMRGGRLTVVEHAGEALGSSMEGGLVIVRGDARARVGHGMHGGTIVVLGDVGQHPGSGMLGGRIVVGGRCQRPPRGVTQTMLSEDDIAELNELLEGQQLHLGRDAVCLVPDAEVARPFVEPETGVTADWSSVLLSPSTDAEVALPRPRTVDLLTVLGGEQCEAPVALDLPLMERADGGLPDDAPPGLVSTAPRARDLVLLDAANIADARDLLADAAGVVLDLASLPDVDDIALDGLLVVATSCLASGGPILLGGSLDDVERLHRLAAKVEADGVLIRVAGTTQIPAAAAMPRIGRSLAHRDVAKAGLFTLAEIPWTPQPEDLLIARAAGLDALVAPAPALSRPQLADHCSGWLAALGLDSIERLARRHLRALDWETAAVSGLRLVGYDRPLPHWLAS